MNMNFFRRNFPLFASFVLVGFISEWVFPLAAYGLTSGPSQPEVQSFEPYGTTDMVDLFSGDFVYNIPLGDVGGYPINISYHGGVAMEQEASWVGLGWNINAGVINRTMRGIPDDFHGSSDHVKREYYVKPNRTLGALYSGLLSSTKEVFGIDVGKIGNQSVDLSVGVYFNNYKGIGYKANMNFSPVSGAGGMASFDSQDPTLKLSPYLSYGGFQGGFTYSGDKGVESFYLKQSLTGAYNREINLPGKPASEAVNLTANRFGGTSAIGYHNPSYVPVSNPNMYFASYNLSFKYGTGNQGTFISTFPIEAMYSEFGVRANEKSKTIPAYGYMHSADGFKNNRGIMDFNRDADNQPNKVITRLGIPQMTNDIYMISGQGTGGHFRAHLPGAVSVKDPVTNHFSVPGENVGMELGLGVGPHFGLDIGLNVNWSKTGPWVQGSALKERMLARKKSGLGGYENWYFKNAGERDEIDMDYYRDLHGEGLMRAQLDDPWSLNTTSLITDAGITAYNSDNMHRDKRAIRNTAISSLTVGEKDWCLQSVIPVIGFNIIEGNLIEQFSSINRDADYRKPNHISQIETLNPDGTRYIYGIPAYNIKQKEVSFSVDASNTRYLRTKARICNTNGAIEYPPGAASISNHLGIDNFFQSHEISPYTHSHLLSAVLSPDYYDVDGNGPTLNDRGSYTKFSYSLIHSDYKWRSPYTSNLDKNGNLISNGMGTFVERNMSDPTDDMAAYVYGEKENWILHSIETKTHVALFIISDREDALSILDEKGGRGTQKLKKLDKIIILTREEYTANISHLQDAIPEKTIHFRYDYSLCKKIPNNSGAPFYNPEDPQNNVNQGGKLTLTKIWFTYGTNEKGKFNTYDFGYNQAANFDYNTLEQDGWGNYKANECGYTNTHDMPYVKQDKSSADLYASAWSLNEIELPTGGTITVNLESDDYSYVQNKEAMVMTQVVGFGETNDPDDMTSELYQSGIQKRTRRFIFFAVDQSIDPADVQSFFPEASGNLYYKFRIDLTGKGDFETVSGYFEPVSPNGVTSHIGIASTSSGTKYGWIYVNKAEINARDIHPATRDAFQKIKTELPHFVFPSSDAMKGGAVDENVIRGLFSVIPKTLALIEGINTYMLGKKMAQKTRTDGSSVIRLFIPGRVKFGGGTRVRSILFSDEWNQISGTERTFTTGIKYDYTVADGDQIISSGVATIEPPTLVEESALFVPAKEYIENFSGPIGLSNQFILNGPLGLDYYPGPSVGYSKVTVSSLGPDEIYNDPNKIIDRHDNGYTVHEFYTAREFPVKAKLSVTDLKRTPKVAEVLVSLAFGVNISTKSLSQGFLIQTNDMHGKFKSSAEFSKLNPDKPIQKETHYYKVKNESALEKELDNEVTVLYKDGTLKDPDNPDPTKATAAVEVEVVFDNKRGESFSSSEGLEGNLDLVLPGPVPIPSLYPSFDGLEHHELYTSSTTKIVRTFGLVDRVVVENESASITTRNVAFDAVTGEVLLTKTETEFNDHLYSLNYPAYWAHDGMGPSSLNHRYTFALTIGNITAGLASVSKELYYTLSEGDVLKKLDGPGTVTRAWVLTKNLVKDVQDPCNESLFEYEVVVIDQEGKILANGNYEFDIMESGRKNMQALSMSSVLSVDDPLDYANDAFGRDIDFEKVIRSSAVGYTNRRKVYEEQYQFVTEPSMNYVKNNPTHIIQKAIYNGQLLAKFSDITDLFEPPPGETFIDDPYGSGNHASERVIFINHFQSVLGTTIDKMAWCPRIEANGDLIVNIKPVPQTPPADAADCEDWPESPIQFRIKKVSGNGSIYDITKENTNSQSGNLLCAGWPEFYFVSPYGYRQFASGNSTTCGFNIGSNITQWMYYFPYMNTTTPHSCNSGTNGPLITKYEGLRVNPYVTGLRSSWIPENNYTYYDTRNVESNREVAGTGNTLNTQNSGYLKDFLPMYINDCHTPEAFHKLEPTNSYGHYPWVLSAKLTMANDNGNELESINAMEIPQAVLYAYNGTLPVAVAKNTKFSELVYDNFEEAYDPAADKSEKTLKWQMHIPFPYNSNLTGNLTSVSTEKAHSGISSMKIPAAGKVAAISDLVKPGLGSSYPNYTANALEFVIQSDNLIRGFTPEPNKTYTASYWVYDPDDSHALVFQANNTSPTWSYEWLMQDVIDYQLGNVPCTQNMMSLMSSHFKAFYTEETNDFWNANNLSISSQKVAEVEGWKLYNVQITVPSGITHLKLTFDNENGSEPIYVDDFRIFPTTGKMESFVYHPVNKRVLAKLDENNYATFYEYDEEGKLVRVKRETERGIITISETRKHVRIKN